jgi:hypothetical protein
MEHRSNASRPYCPAAAAGNSGGPPDTLSFDPIHSCRWVLKQVLSSSMGQRRSCRAGTAALRKRSA